MKAGRPQKNLVALEPGISENQTDEMKKENVRLIVPDAIQATYSNPQREWLKNVAQFIASLRGK